VGQLETFTQDHSYLDRAGRHYRSRWLALLRVCEQPVYETIHQFVFAGNPRGADTPGACRNRDLLHTPPSPLGLITPLRGKPDPNAPSALHVRHFLRQRNNRSGKDEEVRTRPESTKVSVLPYSTAFARADEVYIYAHLKLYEFGES